MEKRQKVWLALLRVSLGVLFFYAGITKVIDPTWSAAGYLQGAKTFAWFYHALTAPGVIGTIDFLNKWGLTLIGLSLFFGVKVRLSAPLGALMMVLYYFPVLTFPYIAPHSFLVDEHIVYFFALLVLYSTHAGRFYGIGAYCERWPLCKMFPKFHNVLD